MSLSWILSILIILAQVSCSNEDHPDTHIKKESANDQADKRVFILSFSIVKPQNFLKSLLVMDVYASRQEGSAKAKIIQSESLELEALSEIDGSSQKISFKGKQNGNEFSIATTKTCQDRKKIVIPLEKSLIAFYFICSLEKPNELKFLIQALPLNKPDGADFFSGGNFHFLTLVKKGSEFQFKSLASFSQYELSSKEDLNFETLISGLEQMPQLEAK